MRRPYSDLIAISMSKYTGGPICRTRWASPRFSEVASLPNPIASGWGDHCKRLRASLLLIPATTTPANATPQPACGTKKAVYTSDS